MELCGVKILCNDEIFRNYHAREKETADNSVYSIVTISDAFVICQPYF